MKKIVQVFGSLDAGGAESRMMDVFRAINRDKYEFIFISLDKRANQFYEKEIEYLGGYVIKIASPREVGIIRHLQEIYSVLCQLKNDGADVIHSHTSYHSGVVLAIATMTGFNVRIAHARTTSSQNNKSIAQKMMIRLGKSLIKRFATYRLALNNETAQALFDCKVDGHNVIQINNAINLDQYKEVKIAKDLADIPKDWIVIGHVGRFQPVKNHRFIIDLFSEFKKSHENSLLVLVGDGPLRPEIESYVNKFNLSASVRFLGLRSDIPSILARIDLFIFPSIFEGLAGTILEAQASGVPCLVSDSVSKTVDMEVGLIRFISLNAEKKEWISIADELLQIPRKSFDHIYSGFSAKGFTLENEISDLTEIYENTYHNHHNI